MLVQSRQHRKTIFFVAALVVSMLFSFFFFDVGTTFAQDTGLETVGTGAGLEETELPVVIGRIIGVFLSVLGIIFLLLVLYSGYLFMTAAGNAEKVDKAKRILIQAVIGLIITLSAFAITNFVVNALTGEGIFGGGSGSGSGGSGLSTEPRSGSLGSGGIEDHYPARGATDVSRNTKIFVTFKEAMDIEDFITDYDTAGTPEDVTDDTTGTTLNHDNVLIYVSADGEEEALSGDEVSVAFTDDLKTFVFNPPILGSSAQDTQYTVFLSSRLSNADGDQVINSDGYEWSFTVGTEIDLTPPTVRSVTPRAGAEYDRNIAVQIVFSEAVDPTAATGTYSADDATSNFDNIQVISADGSLVDGTYAISNSYTTITFTTAEECGTNSCGETITCLPADDDIMVSILAATPGEDPPQVDVFPYDGVVDTSANALDGDGDGEAGDDYDWNFSTSNDINLSAPEVSSISPDILGEDVDLDQKVVITFSDVMLSSSLSSDNISLASSPVHEMWYKIKSAFMNEDGEEVASSADTVDATQVTVSHGIFLESTEEQTYQYSAEIADGVKNQYQNCFYPAEGPNSSGGSCGTTESAPYCCNGVASSSACSFFSS